MQLAAMRSIRCFSQQRHAAGSSVAELILQDGCAHLSLSHRPIEWNGFLITQQLRTLDGLLASQRNKGANVTMRLAVTSLFKGGIRSPLDKPYPSGSMMAAIMSVCFSLREISRALFVLKEEQQQ